jgi:NAD(P)-dependent dehydrogenase (short-subunit alcohol dehydrogenase family)
MPFANQVAIVTGGASGIGRALCEELARRGAVTVVADVRTEGAQAVASAIREAGGRSSAAGLDVRNATQVQGLVDETVRAHGRLDYMFNNAGIGVSGEVRDLTLEHWRTAIDINLMGVVYGVTAAYPVMIRQGAGHIVNIASLAGLIGSPSLAPYATTKSAVVGLSTALRDEAAAWGVRVSVVCPGFVSTAIFDNAIGVKFDKEEVLRSIRLPLMPAADAARAILRGVERNQSVIVFPATARLLWRLSRIHAGLLAPFRRQILRGMRARRGR